MNSYMDTWELATLFTLLVSPAMFLGEYRSASGLASHDAGSASKVIPLFRTWAGEGLLSFELYADESVAQSAEVRDEKYIRLRDELPELCKVIEDKKPIDYNDYRVLWRSVRFDIHNHLCLRITQINKSLLTQKLQRYNTQFTRDELTTGHIAEPERYDYLQAQALNSFKEKYAAFGDRQSLTPSDFKRADTDASLPFWEVLLSLYLRRFISIVSIGYDRYTNVTLPI